jgi:hypothetical protein
MSEFGEFLPILSFGLAPNDLIATVKLAIGEKSLARDTQDLPSRRVANAAVHI